MDQSELSNNTSGVKSRRSLQLFPDDLSIKSTITCNSNLLPNDTVALPGDAGFLEIAGLSSSDAVNARSGVSARPFLSEQLCELRVKLCKVVINSLYQPL